MSDFDGSFGAIISNLFKDNGTKAAYLPCILASALIFSYTSADLVLNQTDLVDYVKTEKTWNIVFENNVVDDNGDNPTFEFDDIWADGDVKVIDFFLDDISVDDGYFVGYIDVKVIPEECNGRTGSEGRCENGIWISDGGEWECDSISATLLGDNSTLTGQWFDSGNTLSGSDSDCEPIYLRIVTYPNYNLHQSFNQTAVNEYQALSPWTVEGWGDGVVSVQINLDVNTYGGFGPADDSEEITILVSVHQFNPTASLVSEQ